jgi:hypothetical protein
MQPDRFPGTVKLPVNDLRHFRDTGAAQHFCNHRDDRFSRDPETLFKAQVEPWRNTAGRIPRGGYCECPGRFGVETFHCDPEQFAGNMDTAPEKGELRYIFADRCAGMCKQFRGEGEVLGGRHVCSQSVGRRRG